MPCAMILAGYDRHDTSNPLLPYAPQQVLTPLEPQSRFWDKLLGI